MELKCPLPLPIAASFRETAYGIQTNSLVRLDEWDGQERKVVCREEEQVKKEEDEAQGAGGDASEPTDGDDVCYCVVLIMSDVRRRLSRQKPEATI